MGALENLRAIDARQAVVVCGADTERRGVIDAVRAHLPGVAVRVFSGVVPEPEDMVARVQSMLEQAAESKSPLIL